MSCWRAAARSPRCTAIRASTAQARARIFDSGRAQGGAGLAGKALGLVPVAALHRQQRPFAKQERQKSVCADFLAAAARPREEHSPPSGSPKRSLRNSLAERGHRRDMPGPRTAARPRRRRYASASRPAGTCGPEHGGPGFGGRVNRPGHPPYCQRSTASAHRSASAGRPVSRRGSRPTPRPCGCPSIACCHPAIEPSLQGGDPALPVGLQARFSTRLAAPSTSPAAMKYPVLPRAGRGAGTIRRRDAVAPESGRAPAVPVRPAACPGTGGGSGTTFPADQAAPVAGSTGRAPPGSRRTRVVQHRFAQRPVHPLEDRGPGQENPVPLRDPVQELRSIYWLTRRSSPPKEPPPPQRAPFP